VPSTDIVTDSVKNYEAENRCVTILDAARRRLEETDDRIERIADTCGCGGEEQMRAAFVRVLKIPPRDYRKHFATNRRAIATS
jgi:transcriptional regulator GlxA family with amidase domain